MNYLYKLRYPLTLLFCVFFVVIFSKVIPYCMDEFGGYHTIMCHHYPFNKINTYRESCNAYDLKLFNTNIVLPLRVGQYIGSFPCLYYYPLFLLWKSPVSARFLGIIFIFLQAIILGYTFRLNKLSVFFALLLFFPYLLQHLIDTGQIGYQITSIFFLYFLINRWCTTLELRYPICASVVLFLGIWTKLSYFWYAPGILMLFLLQVWENKETIFQKKNTLLFFGQLFVSLITLGGLLSILFLSTSPSNPNEKYINVPLSYGTYSIKELLSTAWQRSKILGLLLNPYAAVERIYDFELPSANLLCYVYDILIYLSIPIALFILWKKSSASKYRLIAPTVMYAAFLLTVVMILRTQASRHMHHAILSFPFLILSAILLIKYILQFVQVHNNLILPKILLIRWFIFFVMLNTFFFSTFWWSPVPPVQDASRNEINKFLNNSTLAKNYFYVVIDWGMYYYQALYGPKEQSVIYMEPLDSQDLIDQLKNLKATYKRKLLFIYNSRTPESNMDLIHSSFLVERCKTINENLVWQILIEKDGEKK